MTSTIPALPTQPTVRLIRLILHRTALRTVRQTAQSMRPTPLARFAETVFLRVHRVVTMATQITMTVAHHPAPSSRIILASTIKLSIMSPFAITRLIFNYNLR
jgi:hypothetical protein